MLMNRIMGAFTFRKGVYAEVEQDSNFTSTAWMLVAVVAFLSKLGETAGLAANGRFGAWLMSAVMSTIFELIAFAIAAFFISWAGKTFFKAQVDFGEVVRTLGLAYVWRIVGVIGLLSIISQALTCVLSPISIISAILGIVAWLIAIKEALDLDWGQTIITLILGFIVYWVIVFVAGLILGVMGLTAAGIGGMLSGG